MSFHVITVLELGIDIMSFFLRNNLKFFVGTQVTFYLV